MSLRPVPHSISNRLDDTKAEKCGPKLIILANSFYAYQRRRRTSSNPSGKAPSSSTKLSPEERTAYVMHLITDSSRTHGTRPDSEDSTPSAELCVCLLTSVFLFKLYPLSLFFILFYIALEGLKCDPFTQFQRAMRATYTWGLLIQKLNIIIFGYHDHCICVPFPYVPFLHHYMHRYDLSLGQAGLPGSCVYALRSH